MPEDLALSRLFSSVKPARIAALGPLRYDATAANDLGPQTSGNAQRATDKEQLLSHRCCGAQR